MKQLRSAILAAIPLLALLVWVPVTHAETEVKVVNRPNVSVPSPIPHSDLKVFEAIPVSSGMLMSPLIPLTLDTRGYSHVTLSLAVDVQGMAGRQGMVEATLLPAEPFVVKAFKDNGTELFPVKTGVTVPVSDELHVFGSQPIVQALAFPKYLVYFRNGSDRPVKAYLYVYLSH